MGFIEIIRPDGSGFVMEGGEPVIYKTDVCDVCGKRLVRRHGKSVKVGGEEVLWVCDTCNTPRT